MEELRALRDTLAGLRTALVAEEAGQAERIAALPRESQGSARNLVHYVALRQHDLRKVQLGLWRRGLSSLGRTEGHVLDALSLVIDRLDDALGVPHEPRAIAPSWDDAEHLLHARTRALLGAQPPHRHVSIMVTAPSAAEVDDAWMERLLDAGTDVLRVNAAHEREPEWLHVVATARRVSERRGRPIRIELDLPGPKLRTIALTEGPRVVRWRPERDELGRVVKPHVVSIAPRSAAAGADLPMPDALFAKLEAGHRLVFDDTRGRGRTIEVTDRNGNGARGALTHTAYVVPGTRVALRRGDETLGELTVETADVPPLPVRIPVATGDRLALVAPGRVAPAGMAALGCTLAEAIDSLRAGERVIFDDGHVECVAESASEGVAVVRVTHAAAGRKLGGEKGINLPDTALALPAFSEDDERALAFAVAHVDIVGASFVRGPDDVRELYARLHALGAHEKGVMLKIETAGAFASLPAILLAALARPRVGVMIARGDLAVETGYERMAELQEEILWIAEAAHVPVVWATQVLDTYARTGRPSRAEITDAAMSVRAECVMLNKGPFVAEAVHALDDILRRMEQHQYKKRSLYRRLHLALPR